MSTVLKGILIEGVDYAGKTTLAKGIERELKRQGIDARYKKEYFTDDPDVNLIVREGIRENIGETQDYIFTLATLLDISKTSQQENDPFLIMDRNWLSMVAHCRFFYPNSRFSYVTDLLKRIHLPFASNIYLTSTPEEKARRIMNCPPKSRFDEFLMMRPRIHQEYDDFWLNILPKNENWEIIDNSDTAPNEILYMVLKKIIPG